MKTDLSRGQHPVNAQPFSHLGLSNFSIHGVVGFEYFLCFLQGAGRLKAQSSPGATALPRPAPPLSPAPSTSQPRPSQAQLLPALEKVLGSHLRGLEEFVDGHW